MGMAGGKRCQRMGQCPKDKDRRGTARLWEQGTVKDLGGPVHLRALLGWL